MTKRAKGTYHLISLGCPKNLVDSESMAQILNREGYVPASAPEDAAYLIVNTCGFLKAAREEALMVLTDLASEKLPWQKLIAAGCMTELHRNEILEAVPGIDGLIGTRRWMDILNLIKEMDDKRQQIPYSYFPEVSTVGQDEKGTNRAAVQGGSAYLKIADGCRRSCAYCMIPLIKGSLISRPVDKIVHDAKTLQDSGMKEIILIAQDITDYGHDLNMQDGITTLLENILKAVPDIPWIRLMYTFPGYVTEPLIQLMHNEPQILPYLDMPLQHADPDILRSMRRPSDIMGVRKNLSHIRSMMPDITLRTTFIVGYPGEDDKAFQNLVNFVQEVRFDHMGVFPYSFEPGSPAERLGDPIPEHVKIERLEHLMQIQGEISLERNQRFIGKILDVLIEGVDEENQISIGRSYRDAPEIDGLVVIEGLAPIGEIVPVKINSAITHDLVGELVIQN
ncbi:MAG TPA: 30S ribosomal protein S12 methylthiotransferase RimO [Anaerolineaceae bacterium]|nr:MAG: Ribosomal protein S12 methylthiotransferase RimO [Anaerolineaceae bacterium 46_22]HAF48913.1 30S ribosomal protein S12 methylthiotransferase RimO [Anaerolineaceae bacterium]